MSEPPELLGILKDATATIEKLDRQRAEQTVRRRLAVTGLQSQGWSLARIAEAIGRSKAAVGQMKG